MKSIKAILLSLLTLCCVINADALTIDNGGKANVKKTAKIGKFNEIEASQGIQIILTQATNPGKAEVKTTKSGADFLQVYTEDNTLKVYYNTKGYNNANIKIEGPTIVRVSTPDLREIELSSGASLTMEGNLKVNSKLEVDLSSAGKVTLNDVTCQSLDADLISGSSMTVRSVTGQLKLHASSNSKFRAESVKGNLIDIENSSAAEARINNAEVADIRIEASSAASVDVRNIKATNVTAEASSAADVNLNGRCNELNMESNSAAKISTNGMSAKVMRQNDEMHENYNRAAKERRKQAIKSRKQTEKAQAQSKKARKQAQKARKQAAKASKKAQERNDQNDVRLRIP